jgi:transposase
MSDDGLFPGVTPTDPKPRPIDLSQAPRLRSPRRDQVLLRPCSLEELIPADHKARMVWAVVQRLDLSSFYDRIEARGSTPGRGATDPKLMLSLWIYATSEGEGSARALEELCDGDDAHRWMCGGVSVNHHSLSDFRRDHGPALDDLLTQVLASLAERSLISVNRISQDGTRVRIMAGAASFRKEDRLLQLLEEAKAHVQQLKEQLDAPQAASLSARKKAAMTRAAGERQQRLEEALAQMPQLKEIAANPKNRKKLREKPPKASTTDADARFMRMPDGGTRPAYNVQLAMDTQSRAIVGVDVTNIGSDNAQAAAMREQVEERTGLKVQDHLVDGGYLNLDQIEDAHESSVAMYVPAPKRKNGEDPYTPRPEDTPAIAAWRERMADQASKQIYLLRSQTIETANADLKTHRGLNKIRVRGIQSVLCVALLASLAYNLIHFGKALLS